MNRQEYDAWCRRLWRCQATGKVAWPNRVLAERAAEMHRQDGATAAGAYRCELQYGCHRFHVTSELENRPSRNQRQRHNQPDTFREKRRRQNAARRARRSA